MDVKSIYKEYGKDYLVNELKKLSDEELMIILKDLNSNAFVMTIYQQAIIQSIIYEVMDKFYINLIPIGESKWRENIYNNIALTTRYCVQNWKNNYIEECMTFNEYLNKEDKDMFRKVWRAYDEAQLDNIHSDEPKFFPNESIKIDKGCLFRMVINCNITRDKKRLNELVISPWHEELYVPRKDLMWVSVEQSVKYNTDYNLIICNDVELYKDEIDRVIEVCNKYGKEYRIISDKEISFNDVWNMFKVG